MKKKFLCTLLITVLAASLIAGCGKQKNNTDDAQTADATQSTSANNNSFVITTDNIKVAEYKGLSIDGYNEEVTDEEINSFIDYVLQYVYVPEDETVDVEDASAEEKEIKEEVQSDETDETAETESTDAEEAEEVEPVGTTLTHEDLTDEIVVQVSDGQYKTVAEYREYVKNLVKEENETYFKDSAKNQLFTQVVDNSELIGYDEADLKQYIDYANEYYAEYAEYLGVDMETFRKETMNFETEDEFTKFVEDEAKSNLKTEYIILAIADKEGITVTDADIDAEIKNYIDNGYFATEADVLEYITRDEISTNLKYYKILDIIFDSANIVPYEDTIETTNTSSDIVPLETDASVPSEESTETATN